MKITRSRIVVEYNEFLALTALYSVCTQTKNAKVIDKILCRITTMILNHRVIVFLYDRNHVLLVFVTNPMPRRSYGNRRTFQCAGRAFVSPGLFRFVRLNGK